MIFNKSIYIITLIKHTPKEHLPFKRHIHFCFQLKKALKWMEERDLDVEESGYYNYAVIEHYQEERHLAKEIAWYYFDKQQWKWFACAKPLFSEKVVNWAIG